jgi:hypothetical protein
MIIAHDPQVSGDTLRADFPRVAVRIAATAPNNRRLDCRFLNNSCVLHYQTLKIISSDNTYYLESLISFSQDNTPFSRVYPLKNCQDNNPSTLSTCYDPPV